MRIGFDYRMGGSLHSGIGRYAFEILNHILAKNSNDNFVIFYNPTSVIQEDLDLFSKYGKVELIPVSARHYSYAEQITFLLALNKAKLDIVHFPNFNIPIFYQKPFVVTIHDVVHHKISGHKLSTYFKFLAYKKIIETAAKKSKKIITVSESSKKDIAEILKVPPAKIVVTYEGSTLKPVDLRVVEKVKDSFLLTKPYFLFVGTLERKKNLIGLAQGFERFLAKYKFDMDLVVAGKVDQHYPDIKFQVLDILKNNHVVFTDYISDEQLSALYQGAFAYANASIHEGFGLPGVEAMSFGLPLIVSNIETFNEIYDNAALYFDPHNPDDIAEKFYLLAKDVEFHRQMQEKSTKRSLQFDWGMAATQTLEIYYSSHLPQKTVKIIEDELSGPHEPIRD